MELAALLVPVLLLAALSFVVSYFLNSRLRHLPISVATTLLAISGLLIPLHYVHIFDSQVWYHELRTYQSSEYLSSLLLAIPGLVFAKSKAYNLRAASILTCGLLCILPFGKPVLSKLHNYNYQNKWSDGVCLQSAPFSCGPASVATILRHAGIQTSESKLAHEFNTYSGGTESWYMARNLRKKGLNVEFVIDSELLTPPFPSVAGVRIGHYGHFVSILSISHDSVIIGDPLIGKKVISKAELGNSYVFTGWYMKVTSG